jgi:hypothetical protein
VIDENQNKKKGGKKESKNSTERTRKKELGKKRNEVFPLHAEHGSW